MALVLLLSLAFVGASSASYLDNVVATSNSTLNSTSTLQAHPSIVQVEAHQAWGVWEQNCAANILNSRNILSAASCFSTLPQVRRIRAGANNRNTGGIIIYVDQVINYPTGNSTNQAADISVVRLASTLTYSPLIRQTVIPAPQTFIPNGLALTQGGWGRSNSSNALSVVQVRTVSSSHCGFNQTASNSTSNSTSNVLCATLTEGFNVSNADGGSPWFFGNITVGVVSGLNYGNNSWSGIVAAAVAPYTNWIVSNAV